MEQGTNISLQTSPNIVHLKYTQMKETILMLAILCLGPDYTSAPGKGYTIANKIHLKGDEKWDFLHSDDAAGRLYVSHGSVVQVVDEAKGEVAGEISGLSGVHGIAIASAYNKGFISNGADNSVTVFDTKTLKVVTKITGIGTKPDEIYFEPYSKKVFVFNGKSNNANVIDPKTNQVIATIALSGKPEISVSDEKGKIYVNIEDKSSIAVINSMTYKVEQVWSIAPGKEPTGIALDEKTHRLFSTCANKLMVIVDATNGHVLETLPIGEDPDGAAFDPELKRIYSANGDGTLTVIGEDGNGKLSVMENFPTQKEANTIALNKRTHHIYLSTADFDTTGSGKPKITPNSFVVLD